MFCVLYVSLAVAVNIKAILNADHAHHQWKAKRALEGAAKSNVSNLPVGSGFYPFDFGATGSLVDTKFKLSTSEMTVISAWDCFCPGDAFEILVDGRLASELKGDCLSIPEGVCDPQTTVMQPLSCAREALSGRSSYCYARTIVPKSAEISIRVKQSILGSGTGFIRADKACQVGPDQWAACCLLDDTCSVSINYE